MPLRVLAVAATNVATLVMGVVAAAGVPATEPLGVPRIVAEFGAWGVAGVLLALNWWLVRRLVCDLSARIAENGRLVSLLVVVLAERPCLLGEQRMSEAAKLVRQAVAPKEL